MYSAAIPFAMLSVTPWMQVSILMYVSRLSFPVGILSGICNAPECDFWSILSYKEIERSQEGKIGKVGRIFFRLTCKA